MLLEAEIEQEEQEVTQLPATQPEPVDDSERRFWTELDLIAKIAECSREIEESEACLESLKNQTKEAKEFLKGQEVLLRRLSSRLRDVVSGKPLPVEPGKVIDANCTEEKQPSSEWRDHPTKDLLADTKGIGKAKLESIIELAPTAGHLEDLRGQASLECKSFRELLPKGCGQAMADTIEQALIDWIGICSAKQEDDEDDDPIVDFIADDL